MDLADPLVLLDRRPLGAATSCSRASTSASACCCRSCPGTSAERATHVRDDRARLGRQRGVARGRRRARRSPPFPAWYATMFSGFYLALLLVLFFLIVRVVSFEWRAQGPTARAGARLWTWANTVGSFGASLVWGVGLSALLVRRPARLERRLHRRLLPTCSARTRCSAGIAIVAPLRLPRRDLPHAPHDRRAVRAGGAAARRLSLAAAVVGARRSSPGRSPSQSTATTRRRRSARRRRVLGIAALVLSVLFVLGTAQRPARSRRPPLAPSLVGRDAVHEPLPAGDGVEHRLRQQPHRRQRRRRRTTRSQ